MASRWRHDPFDASVSPLVVMMDDFASPRWSMRWRDWTRGDRRALWWFALVPSALFLVPALFNHPAIDADNLIQNFPLRVLVGRQLDGGHLPLLNPYGNAGTPLLAGMNAGALYPLTLLFALLPAILAWLVNLIAVYFVSAVGTFSLARWHGLSTRASVFAALSYSYSGAMIGQVVHLGVVQGFSLLPWVILLLVSLARRLRAPVPSGVRASARSLAPWALSGVILWALVFFTGEPRAIAEVELVVLVVLVAVFFFPSSYQLVSWRARRYYAFTLGLSFVWGVALAGAQLLPAWSFIRFSERSVITYGFFGAGSLPLRWTMLLGVPDVLGGNGALGTSSYFASYNLPEVSGYAGVLALCAGASFITHLTRRGWRVAERDFALYLFLAGAGLFASWGNFTVLGHLFRALPLFGSTRLQSRNTVLVDLGFSMLLAWWINRLERDPSRRLRYGAVAPAVTIALICLFALARGPWLVRHLGVTPALSALASNLTPALVVHLSVALVVLGLLIVGARQHSLTNLLFVVLVLDLVSFTLFDATGLIGGPTSAEPSRASATRVLSTQGRFALVDPSGAHTQLFRQLGEPNMNVFTGLASAQGYGALVSNYYDASTGTHPQSGLSACHLAEGKFSQLRLNSLVVGSSLLESTRQNRDTLPCVVAPPLTRTARYFGQVSSIRAIHLTLTSSATPGLEATLRLVSATGRAFGPRYLVTSSGHSRIVLARATRAGGFVVQSLTRVQLTSASVETDAVTTYFLNSDFDLALSSSTWRLHATLDRAQSFRTTKLRARAWLLRSKGSGRIVTIATSSWGDAWIRVHATRTTVLVRSEAYLPGWRATAVNESSGASLALSVSRAGLIQRVTVPKGNWTIHFHYHAPYIEAGVASSASAGVALVASLWLVRRRRFDKVNA